MRKSARLAIKAVCGASRSSLSLSGKKAVVHAASALQRAAFVASIFRRPSPQARRSPSRMSFATCQASGSRGDLRQILHVGASRQRPCAGSRRAALGSRLVQRLVEPGEHRPIGFTVIGRENL